MRLFTLGACVLLALAGCSTERVAGAAAEAAPPPPPAGMPASAAGGACILWDYAFLEERLGVRFDVAAADQAGDVSTCVVQSVGAERPDLSLSVLERTEADAEVFTEHLRPAGAAPVKGLGRAAYRLVTKATRDHGPVVEVGWLSADRQVLTLRFTFAVGASPADAGRLATRLVTLAGDLDG